MIEVPRGALTADEIAQTAEFFSFGTNDLTQTCLGMSRDDSGSSLDLTRNSKSSRRIHRYDSTIRCRSTDHMAVEKGNKTRPGIKARYLW